MRGGPSKGKMGGRTPLQPGPPPATRARTHIMRSSPLACARLGIGAARSSHPRAGAPGTASPSRPLSETRASAHHLPASFASVSPRRLQLSREHLSALHERMHSTALVLRRCHPSLRIAHTSLSSPPATPHAQLWRWDSAASALSAFSPSTSPTHLSEPPVERTHLCCPRAAVRRRRAAATPHAHAP